MTFILNRLTCFMFLSWDGSLVCFHSNFSLFWSVPKVLFNAIYMSKRYTASLRLNC